MIGKTIGKYRFVEELGRGPLGVVYKAIDETLDREVAIKVLNPELGNSELMQHFQSEATTLARLHHADIATIHEFQRSDADLLMVMEYVKGETLEQLAQRCGPLPSERAAYLVAQVLGALEHAHGAGVVHRDLTPSSVTVTELGGIKVMDFGMARVAAADQATSDGFTVGPPSYMSPERLTGRDVDGRTDVYSAGVLFYRLLTGHVPFEASTPLDMMQRQLSGNPTPLDAYRQDLPPWCQAIVDRAIARAADDRFPTAEAFRSTLNAAIAEATEATGVYAVVQGSGSADPEELTMAAPIPVTIAAPIPLADAPTMAAWTPAPSSAPQPTPTGAQLAPTQTMPAGAASPTATGTTVVLKRHQFAVVGGLLLALVAGVIVLAVVALRRPSTVVVAPTPAEPGSAMQTGAPAAPASGAPAPVSSTAAPSGVVASPSPPPLEIAPPPLVIPAPPPVKAPAAAPASAASPTTAANTPAPVTVAPARPGVVTSAFRFDARVVVADGDKRREREATVLIADGNVTVSEKEKSAKALYVVPVESLVGLTYSISRQPLWNSPDGPAEAMKVEGGAFGFLKGGKNWFGLQTNDSLLVLSVDDEAVGRVTAGLQERTGLKLQRLAEPKD